MTAAAEEPRPSEDSFWMQQRSAWLRGLGAEPNPLVGCVLVSHGQCIGQGSMRVTAEPMPSGRR